MTDFDIREVRADRDEWKRLWQERDVEAAALQARLAEAQAEYEDQVKWASHYAARAGRLEDALMHLHQAYANKHSPQHRAAALNSAWGVLHAKADSASVCQCDSPAATHRDGWCPSCGRQRATVTVSPTSESRK